MTDSNSKSEGGASTADPRATASIYLQPAHLAGGDLCELHRPDAHRLLILVGDVSGRGPATVALASRFADRWRRAAGESPDAPDRALQAVEADLRERNPESLFITALAARLDLRTGELLCSNAGHEPPYVLGPRGLRRLELGGRPPLFAVEGWAGGLERLHLGAGEQLCVITDGVVDTLDPSGRRFGRPALEQTLRRAAQASPEEVVAALRVELGRFASTAEQPDDLAAVVVRWNGPRPEGADRSGREAGFPARVEALPELRGFVEDASLQLGADGPAILRIALVAEELFLNSVQHGYRGAAGTVRVVLDARDDELRLVMEDRAPAFDPFAAVPEPDATAPRVGGLGRVLVAGLATRHRYQRLDGCNRVTVHMLRRAS